MRPVLLLVMLAMACRDDKPAEQAKPRRPFVLPKRAPPKFVPNRGAAVLAARHLQGSGDAGDWEGRWAGKQTLVGGILAGDLPVAMKISRTSDGRLRFVQDQYGVSVIQYLVPSPDDPHLAAGVDVKTMGANGVTFTTRAELTAIVSGDHLVIGMHSEITNPGSYQGMDIPAPPPTESVTTLERKP